MKHIQKQQPSTEFENLPKLKNWEEFSKPENVIVKQELKQQLLSEQGDICCYCEQKIKADTSHIEHLKPKSLYPKETFNYNNLLASCENSKSCGHKKKRWYSSNMVSPLNSDCEERFIYTREGHISPKNETDKDAKETINKLGLNTKKLKNRRKIIASIFPPLEKNMKQDDSVIEELLKDGEFWTTVKYFQSNYG